MPRINQQPGNRPVLFVNALEQFRCHYPNEATSLKRAISLISINSKSPSHTIAAAVFASLPSRPQQRMVALKASEINQFRDVLDI